MYCSKYKVECRIKLHKTLTFPRGRFLTPCAPTNFSFCTVNNYVSKHNVSLIVLYTSIPYDSYFAQSNTTLKNVCKYYRAVQVKSFLHVTVAEHGKNSAQQRSCCAGTVTLTRI